MTFMKNFQMAMIENIIHAFLAIQNVMSKEVETWICRKISIVTCPGSRGGMPSVGVFLRDTSPYLREFWRKPRKTMNGFVDKRDRELNSVPLVYQFEHRGAQKLVAPKFSMLSHIVIKFSS